MQTFQAPINGAHLPIDDETEGRPSAEALSLLHRARNAAFAEAARGQLGRGLSLLNDALMQVPASHDLLSDMAALLLSAGEHEMAASYAIRALAVTPEHGPSLYTLGFAQVALNRTADALATLQRLQCPGDARASLMRDAPELAPLVDTEIERLQAIAA